MFLGQDFLNSMQEEPSYSGDLLELEIYFQDLKILLNSIVINNGAPLPLTQYFFFQIHSL